MIIDFIIKDFVYEKYFFNHILKLFKMIVKNISYFK